MWGGVSVRSKNGKNLMRTLQNVYFPMRLASTKSPRIPSVQNDNVRKMCREGFSVSAHNYKIPSTGDVPEFEHLANIVVNLFI